jgi:multiple sugar transport system permease protein
MGVTSTDGGSAAGGTADGGGDEVGEPGDGGGDDDDCSTTDTWPAAAGSAHATTANRTDPSMVHLYSPPVPETLRQLAGLAGRATRATLAVVAVVLVVAAFARVAYRTATAGRLAPGEIELTVMHWSGEGGQEEDLIVRNALAEFERANPGVRVKRLNAGSSAEFYTKLQTMMVAGEAPDVFYVGYERVANFVSLDLLRPIDDFVERERAARAAGDAGALDLGAFYPQTVDAFRSDGTRVGTGPLYGIPKDFTTVGFYYNKDLFRRAGLAFPSKDWTWDDYIAAARAIGALNPPGTPETDAIIGSEFVTWSFVARTYLRTEGAEAIGDDLRTIRLNEPAAVAALERLRAWRHDEDGALVPGNSKLASGSAIFNSGKIGLAGPFGRWVVPAYRKIPPASEGGFEWDFAPLPRGSAEANCVLTVSWSIARDSKHPEEAWKLVKWLTNRESQAANARLGLAIPTMREVAEGPDFLVSDLPPANNQGFLDAIPEATVIGWPADAAFDEILGSALDQGLRSGDLTIPETLATFDEKWSTHTNFVPGGAAPPPVAWSLFTALGAALLGLFVAAVAYLLVRAPSGTNARREERAGFLLVSPWVAGFLLFMAFPILVSLILSMTNWKGVGPLSSADWVGLDNYAQLAMRDGTFHTSLRVTAYYALLAVPAGQILALLAAVVMTQKVRGIALFRAAWYLPSVLAGVGIAILWQFIFDGQGGLLKSLAAPLGIAMPDWLNADAGVYGPPAFALMSLWFVGGSMMVYIAGLQQIPIELHEAAEIDGAGPVRRFFRVTLPMLSPVILFNLIMAVIGSFQVFTQAYVMTGGGPGDKTRFYVLYLYNKAFQTYDMGYASAMAWILLAIVLVLTVLILRSSARAVYYESLKKS